MKKGLLLLLLTVAITSSAMANESHNHKNGSFWEVMGDFGWRLIHNDFPEYSKYADDYKKYNEKPWYLKWLD